MIFLISVACRIQPLKLSCLQTGSSSRSRYTFISLTGVPPAIKGFQTLVDDASVPLIRDFQERLRIVDITNSMCFELRLLQDTFGRPSHLHLAHNHFMS